MYLMTGQFQLLVAMAVSMLVLARIACNSRLLAMPRRVLSSAVLLVCVLGLGCWPNSSFANYAGGFTSLVTTNVTTGTETYNGHTDHYLDNGILHVDITSSGSVDSIKYLKPGLPGTPSANGVETTSQSGANFGNHTAIYYYWYPDGNGDCVYQNTTTGSTNADISYLRTFNPSSDKVVADVELHYVLGKGNTGLYAYLVVKHPASYASYPTNLSISFIQVLWPTAHDGTDFFFENSYVDEGVKYGLVMNGQYQQRVGLQPNFWDNYHTTNLINIATNMTLPQEIVHYQTGIFAGCTNGKYSYTFDYPKLGTFGMASDINQMGIWYVAGGHEYQNNGPTACEYSGGIGGLITFEPLIAHYGNTGLTVSSNANFAKVYGPWLFYVNSQSNGYACWQDAQQQVLAEQQAWPYAWLVNTNYQSANQRATVSGKLVINDPLRPQASAAGAWVGLAAPNNGLEVATNDWQWQADGYQFWTQSDSNGNFTLPPVATLSPYGTNALYELYAYCAGTNGSVGQFQAGPFQFAPGATTNLGTLTWNVQHQGSNILWEIGFPDRTAAEFRNGDQYAVPALWLSFPGQFPNPMTYTVGASSWSNDWNYVQGAYIGYSVSNGITYAILTNMVWNIKFNLPKKPLSGNLVLNTVWAGANGAAIQVFINNTNASGTPFRDFYPNIPFPSGVNADSLIRQGIHDKYGIDHTSIPVSNFVAGTNYITLVQRRAATALADYVFYDYLDLELPTPRPPIGLTTAAGDSKVVLSWTTSPGATGYYVSQSKTSGGPYTLVGTNISTLTFTNTGLTNGVVYYYTVSATNSFGASDVSPQASGRPVATNSPAIGYSPISAGQITLSWPTNHVGWRLQVQTNSLNQGLGTDWTTVDGSTNNSQISLPVNAANASVFYRLVFP
jgi:Polysaccharide lyase family 4, domain III/Polysaccharide lyase family 4, domain II